MKNSTTSVILVQAMASATTGFQNSVSPGAICHSPRSMYDSPHGEPRKDQQRQKNRQIDYRADDVVFVVVSSVLVFLSRFVRRVRSFRFSPQYLLIRYSSGNRNIQMMSTKCQYRPKFST